MGEAVVIRNPLIPWALLLTGILIGLWLLRADAREDAQDDLRVEQALGRAERHAEALDSVEVEIGAREDSLRLKTEENERLRAEKDQVEIRYARLRAETDEALQPDVTFTGSDSLLAHRADSLLRTRMEGAVRIVPLSPGRFDAPRPLLADWINLITTTLPAVQRERAEAKTLNDLQNSVIKAQDEHLALTERQLSSTAEGLRLCKAECSEYRGVVDIQQRQITRLKWKWRITVVAAGIGLVVL